MLDLLSAICLILVIEGALYALFPGAMKRAMERLLALADSTVRNAGLTAAVMGVFLLWLIRG